MGRPTSSVWNHFIKENFYGRNIAICKYCKTKYLSINATKLKKHIEKCLKCPLHVLPSFPANEEESMQSTSTSDDDIVALVDFLPSRSASIDELSSLHSASKRAKKDSQSVLSTFLSTMTNSETEKLDLAFARAVYSSSCPLSLADNIYWKQFLCQIRPSYKVPSRRDLTNHLLDKAYSNVEEISTDKINNAEFLTILTNGWSNIKNESMISFIVGTPSPIFYKSIEINSNKHTSEYISEELTKVINEIGGHKVIALVTDNACNMKAAWRILQINYPGLNTIGCGAHGLKLLLEDIEKIETFQFLISKSKQVIKYFNRKHTLLSVFTKKQKQKIGTAASTLKLPEETRWNSTYIMFEGLLDCKRSLQEVALNKNVDQDVRRLVLDKDIFWASIEDLINVSKLICDSIALIESDSAVLSDVPHAFHNIKNSSSLLNSTSLQTDEKERIISVIEKRQKMCCQPIHLAAYVLDPRYPQNHLNSEEYGIVLDFISNFPATAGGVLADFAQFQAREGIYSNDAIWSAAESVSPLVWWKGLLFDQTLSTVATKLFSIPPSAAACEQVVSAFSETHIALRKRLSNDKVSKLIAVRSNLILQNEISEEEHVPDK